MATPIGRGEVTSPLPITIVASPLTHRSLTQRIPWLWYDHVVSRTRLALWVLSLLLFLLLHGTQVLFAAFAGELSHFLRDPIWLVTSGVPALASFGIGYARQALTRFWSNMRPWLANSEEEVLLFEASLPPLLMRFFWPIALLVTAQEVLYVLVSREGHWLQSYAHPQPLAAVTLLTAPVMGYFVGGTVSATAFGLGFFAEHVQPPPRLEARFYPRR